MSGPRAGKGGDRARGRGKGGGSKNWNGNSDDNASHTLRDRMTQGLYSRGQSKQPTQRGGRGSANTAGSRKAGASDSKNGDKMQLFDPTKTGWFTGVWNSTPFPDNDIEGRLRHLKRQRPELRQNFIDRGLMNPEGQMRLQDAVNLYGLCEDMCPEYERVVRMKEDYTVGRFERTLGTEHLPKLERPFDESRMVKAYHRASAGDEVELVSDLRSPQACLRSSTFIFSGLNPDNFIQRQRFTWDRARGINRDLRTQCIRRRDIECYLTCIERNARYSLLDFHYMEYDVNATGHYLQLVSNSFKALQERYDDNRRDRVLDKDYIYSKNEPEFLAYRIILTPMYTEDKYEFHLAKQPLAVQQHPRVVTAVEIMRLFKCALHTHGSFRGCQANWRRYWTFIKSSRVSYLMACAAGMTFDFLRHAVLHCVWRAYRQGRTTVDTWTVEKLTDAMGFDTDEQTMDYCQIYGFVFDVNKDGRTFIDFAKRPRDCDVIYLTKAEEDKRKRQLFSETIIEPKRFDRGLFAVIEGLSVEEARQQGLTYQDVQREPQNGENADDGDSLFIPESNITDPSTTPLSQASGNTTNPFASPLQLSAPSVSSASNPFLKAAEQQQPTSGLGVNAGVTVQPGVFDPNKHSIKFATAPSASPLVAAPPVQAMSSGSAVNPFTNESKTPATTQTNFFAKFVTSKAETPGSVQLPQSSTSTPPGNALKSEIGSSKQNPLPQFSFTPTTTPSQPNAAPQKEEQEQAEQKRRDAEEKQRKEAEARKRVEEARQAQKAREAEKRHQEAAAAEQQRQEHVRREQEEQLRIAREAQERQQEADEAKRKEFRAKEQALQALVEDVMFHQEEGLMLQFVENASLNIAQEVMMEIAMEKAEAGGDEMLRKRDMRLKKAGLASIAARVNKNKREREVRERRKRIKEQRARAASMLSEGQENPSQQNAVGVHTGSNGAKNTQRKTRGAGPNGVKDTQRKTNVAKAQHPTHVRPASNHDPHAAAPPVCKVTQAVSVSFSGPNGTQAVHEYSKSYQQSTAPIDRTQTDWFKLRALGLDPSKHRKRSFDSTSEEDEEQVETKRPKLFSPVTNGVVKDIGEQPLTSTTEDQLAQLRAVQQKSGKSVSSSPQPNHVQDQPIARTSLVGSSNSLIARARQSIATSITGPKISGQSISKYGHSRGQGTNRTLERAKHLLGKTTTMQHDFSRSVPDLGFGTYSPIHSVHRRSATGSTTDRPTYWQRHSRFVPKHLYGKGPEAVRAYIRKLRPEATKNEAQSHNVEFIERPSPIQTQLSYVAPRQDVSQNGTLNQYHGYDHGHNAAVFADDNTVHMNENFVYGEQLKGSHGYEQELSHHDAGQPHYNWSASGSYDEEEGDGDSEMVDQEDEEEYDGVSEDEDSINSGYSPYNRGDYTDEDGDENMTDEDGDEEMTDDDEQYAQPVQQARFCRAPPRSGPGATEDDAIELSD